MNVKRLLSLLLLIITALVITGCGIQEGTVTKKWHEKARTYWIVIPIPHTMCTGGKTNTCTTYYTYIPVQQYDDPDWVIHIVKGDKSNDLYLSESQWNKVKVGDYYKAAKGQKTGDPKKELKRGHEAKHKDDAERAKRKHEKAS